jgi:hypothetical protein
MASTAVIRQSHTFIDGYSIAMSPPIPGHPLHAVCSMADRVLIDRAPTPTLLSEERGNGADDPRFRRCRSISGTCLRSDGSHWLTGIHSDTEVTRLCGRELPRVKVDPRPDGRHPPSLRCPRRWAGTHG